MHFSDVFVFEKGREWQRLDRETKAKTEADRQAAADAADAALLSAAMR